MQLEGWHLGELVALLSNMLLTMRSSKICAFPQLFGRSGSTLSSNLVDGKIKIIDSLFPQNP